MITADGRDLSWGCKIERLTPQSPRSCPPKTTWDEGSSGIEASKAKTQSGSPKTETSTLNSKPHNPKPLCKPFGEPRHTDSPLGPSEAQATRYSVRVCDFWDLLRLALHTCNINPKPDKP